MRKIANLDFPDLQDDYTYAKEWKPSYGIYALGPQILVVAKTRIEGAWKAYCGVVLGQRHEEEMYGVAETGSPVEEKVARIMFPRLEDLPYAK